MNRIQVLPEILANKIAAGEIVERPASVVKELVENSIDARSRKIQVTVSAGGKRSLTVRDDGEGMSQDDAILAFEHHATSKLRTAEDLGSIATLGFRGEALPSIASVSRLTLATRASDEQGAGTEIEIQGGILRSVKAVAWDAGTEVTVRDLFFNVPARRKFLKSHDTELGHIARLVTHCALAHPEIRFTLQSDGRLLVDAAAAQSLRDRIFQLFGDAFLDDLVEVSGQSGAIRVHGFCSRPHDQRTNANSQFFYVNRRMVRDRVLAGALRQAYRTRMPASAYPAAILFVDLPFDAVDVNAHPAKTEIRFRDQAAVYGLVSGSLEQSLTQNPRVPSYEHRPAAPSGMPAYVSTAALDFGLPLPAGPAGAPAAAPASLAGEPSAVLRAESVRILGQLHDSYIIACDSQGLLIVDQHVAHERILYERLSSALKGSGVESQGLLVPISTEIPPHQMAIFERVAPELARNGFEAERFGGNTILVRSVPAVAGEADCRTLILEILEGLGGDERTLDMAEVRDRIAVRTACRAAIKVNMPLSAEKMRWLIDELGRTRVPTNCPHGRAVILRFSMHEIERNFGRA